MTTCYMKIMVLAVSTFYVLVCCYNNKHKLKGVQFNKVLCLYKIKFDPVGDLKSPFVMLTTQAAVVN